MTATRSPLGARATRFVEAVRGGCDGPVGVAILGVCNVTPDSISDGGDHFAQGAACARVDALISEGACVVDIGGESTRPGAEAVPYAVQLTRILEVVRYAATRVAVSVDTRNASVAEACLLAGAHAVNDVSMLFDPRLAEVTARHGAALIVQHARETPDAPRGFGGPPRTPYADVIVEVASELEKARETARALGIAEDALFVDPGFGFGKTAADSLALLTRFDELAQSLGQTPASFVCGTSRKSFLRALVPSDADNDPKRLAASLASAGHLAANPSVAMLRVHDVSVTRSYLAALRTLRPQ